MKSPIFPSKPQTSLNREKKVSQSRTSFAMLFRILLQICYLIETLYRPMKHISLPISNEARYDYGGAASTQDI